MGQQTNRGYKLDQKGQEVQDALNKIIGLSPGHLDSIGIYHGSTSYWNHKTGYVPEEGTIIIYSDYKKKTENGRTVYVPGIKIGSGNAYVQDLAFLSTGDAIDVMDHINNNNIHITDAERQKWNNKLNVRDNYEVSGEVLIFNRD